MEKEWLAKKLERSVSLNKRKALIESGLEITTTAQCELLSISRSAYYYNYREYKINCVNSKI
jgi:putative transposase